YVRFFIHDIFSYFNATIKTYIYPLSLHDALPILDVATDVMHAKDGDNEHLWYNSKTMGKLADYLVKENAKLDPKNETYYKKNARSEEHTSELQSRFDIVCRLLLEKKNHTRQKI